MQVITSKSIAETKTIAQEFARSLTGGTRARVIALVGDLGAGKTMFTQAFAAALGVADKVASPTFVILKIYELNKRIAFRHLVHIDAYRLASPQELAHLGFHALVKDKDAIVVIEWADRVRALIPKDAIWISFAHGDKEEVRELTISSQK